MGVPKSRAEAKRLGAKTYFTGEPCRSGHVDGRTTANGTCITCGKASGRKYWKKARAADPEKYRRRLRTYYAQQTPAQRRRRLDYQREWRKSPQARRYVMALRIRCRINMALRTTAQTKKGNTVALLGCSVPEYKSYLEKKFLPGMTWDNWGAWHIDHVKAVSRFNLATLKGQKAAFHFSNTQPLWGPDNLRKGAR